MAAKLHQETGIAPVAPARFYTFTDLEEFEQLNKYKEVNRNTPRPN